MKLNGYSRSGSAICGILFYLLKRINILKSKNMSYYKIVDGRKMDGLLLDMASNAVKGQGDGRISKEDSVLL